jgi:hypothetical protein
LGRRLKALQSQINNVYDDIVLNDTTAQQIKKKYSLKLSGILN